MSLLYRCVLHYSLPLSPSLFLPHNVEGSRDGGSSSESDDGSIEYNTAPPSPEIGAQRKPIISIENAGHAGKYLSYTTREILTSSLSFEDMRIIIDDSPVEPTPLTIPQMQTVASIEEDKREKGTSSNTQTAPRLSSSASISSSFLSKLEVYRRMYVCLWRNRIRSTYMFVLLIAELAYRCQ